MINDPLLNKSRDPDAWDPPVAATRPPATTRRTRRRKTATSARILAVGVSASAMFALTANYGASAKRHAPSQPLDHGVGTDRIQGDQTNASATGLQQQSQQSATAQPNQSRAATASPQQTQTNAPRVVQVPVQPAAPADPGQSGGNTQQSSGSS